MLTNIAYTYPHAKSEAVISAVQNESLDDDGSMFGK